jgi:transposase
VEKLPDLSRLSSSDKDELIYFLWAQNQQLREEVAQLRLIVQQQGERIKELEARLSKNSQNSSKPPSSDGYKKPEPKSQRKKTGRPSGGQKGHVGATLEQTNNPDFIETHTVEVCAQCSNSLSGIKITGHECRQVFDIPPVKVEVTEHQAEIKRCSTCGFVNKGKFPPGIAQPVQYGAGVKATVIYLNHYQLIPYKRVQELFRDFYALPLSEGTVFNISHTCYEALANFSNTVKNQLISSQRVHFDESGLRVMKQLVWLHVASTAKLTHYAIHENRGQKAMDAIGILPHFSGKALHDHWKSYFYYLCEHGLCNAHHLRELTYLEETYEQVWCDKLKSLLLDIKDESEKRQAKGYRRFMPKRLRYFEQRYDRILRQGLKEIPVLLLQSGKRGRPRQHPAKNLYDRLKAHKTETLAFMYDFDVPFDNNQGERDIRMIKTKQKISGCFRSVEGGDMFCRIRGYISTVKKHAVNVLDSLSQVFEGNAFIPESII